MSNCLLSKKSSFYLSVGTGMAGGYTKAVLNKLNRTGMVQLYMKTESNMGANITTLTNDIKDVMDYFKSLEEEIAIVKNQTIN